MRPFTDYVQDRKVNALYYGALKYAKESHFMSFTRATWKPMNSNASPNGVVVYPILETLEFWEDTPNGKHFLKFNGPQEKLYILKTNQDYTEYNESQLRRDLKTLETIYNYKPNEKLIRTLIRQGAHEAAARERNKFQTLIESATKYSMNESEILWDVTRWMATNGRNPNEHFPDNAAQRWTNILRKLGITAISGKDTAIFFDINEFEVIDEIHN